ncbi:HEAT repeat domain-containing protein [Streptomyces sp. bgisy126]|uniref:HEAT repeat domain-containing protein n=1 Tax=unclassified Streptomyces TaxID=2593676 RepID=UPI003EBCD3E1
MDDEDWAGWPELWAGTEADMRVVMGAILREVKDGFRYEEIPWQRFPHFYGPGEEVPGRLTTLASEDAEDAGRALGELWEHLHHQGSTIAVGALAVPFLLRIAVTGLAGLRADTLRLVAEIGRCQHFGDGTREGLLQVTEDPLEVEGTTMCPTNWTIQAARDAITDDLHLVFPLLSDPDPDVRSEAAFVLAEATSDIQRVSSTLHHMLAEEDDPVVCVSLTLAIARLAREHQDENAPSWARELWSDPGRSPEIRIGAGLAWLCLVDDPAPDELRALLTDLSTDRCSDLFQRVPWIRPVDYYGSGLRRCIHEMLTPDLPYPSDGPSPFCEEPSTFSCGQPDRTGLAIDPGQPSAATGPSPRPPTLPEKLRPQLDSAATPTWTEKTQMEFLLTSVKGSTRPLAERQDVSRRRVQRYRAGALAAVPTA